MSNKIDGVGFEPEARKLDAEIGNKRPALRVVTLDLVLRRPVVSRITCGARHEPPLLRQVVMRQLIKRLLVMCGWSKVVRGHVACSMQFREMSCGCKAL
jgi:hypothetical protein